MLRPSDFNKAHRTVNVVPYQILPDAQELPERGASNGGVFHRGQIVWTQESPATVSMPHTAIGFVEGLGHVLIDPRVLRTVDSGPASRN